MKNAVGMVAYYSPTGRKVKARRFGILARLRLKKRREAMDDLAGARRWWI